MPDAPPVVGLLLAGGLSRRMGGGDKSLRLLAGRPVLAHVIERIQPQVRRLCLNANGDPSRFTIYGLPVVPDSVEGFVGPLAGVLAGLDWAAANAPDCHWVASAPTDSPFLPRDLVRRLLSPCLAGEADMACATSDGQAHPVVGIWPVSLRAELRRALVEEGVRKVDLWTARYRLAQVEFSSEPVDPFFNANRPEDLAEAERLASLAP
ncbi:molybdenum cofactor guanylyltransferase MobA [Hypericibacter sp.]|uniref:molybdenum cofactor guanylyltransferase MobA n=1 Tax=Hypericibacter sp. TaxID=2705401 RepID=UPI003D6CE4BC